MDFGFENPNIIGDNNIFNDMAVKEPEKVDLMSKYLQDARGTGSHKNIIRLHIDFKLSYLDKKGNYWTTNFLK